MASKTKQIVFEIIERALVAGVLSYLKISSTFPTYLVTKLVEHGFDKLIVPIFNHLLNNGHLYYDMKRGKIKIRKLNQHRDKNDKVNYDRIIDDILH